MTNTASTARATSATPPTPAATPATGKEASVDLGNIVIVVDMTGVFECSKVAVVRYLDVDTAENNITAVFTMSKCGCKITTG